MTPAISRNELRAAVRAKRNALTLLQQQTAAQALTQQLIKSKTVQQAERIALYLANDAELSLQPFIQWCWQQNKQVYLPVLHPFCSGYLLFLQYQPNSKMTVNKYNIAEPKLNVNIVCPATQLDIIFTPLVAFDHKGERLGMGGGFYDRTLAYVAKHQLSAENSTKIMGLAHDCQQVESVPTESWDIPLPEIYTPTQHFSF